MNQRPVKPTLASIANLVGVSVNTVSRALRAPHTVRAELRARIKTAMEELNYVPNRLAGGLAGTRSDIVGVVVTSLYYSEFATILDTLQGRLHRDSALQVMLANTRYDAEEEAVLVRSLLSWRPAAMALIGVDHHPMVRELLRNADVPIIEMWDIGGDIIDSAVGIDHKAVGTAQARHLVEQGCRKIAFLGSVRQEDARARKRYEGVSSFLNEAALAPPVLKVRQQGGDAVLGEILAQELLREHPDIDGIVCNSDVVAFGVLRTITNWPQELGKIAIIGFGDSEASNCMTPSLSSVRPDRAQIGEITADLILARIAGKPSQTVSADWNLVCRQSSLRR